MHPVQGQNASLMDGECSISNASNTSFVNDEQEYVWDGFTGGEELTDVPNDDYYEKLMMAAKFGQTLLHKNSELESINYQLKCTTEEQGLEIQHLTKQLAWLREVNESKTRMFEQLDISYQDLESTNKKLKLEVKEWRERVTKCMNTYESQEDQILSLKAELESLRKTQGKKTRERFRRRTIDGSLPNINQEVFDLQSFLESSFEFSQSIREKQENKEVFTSNNEEIIALQEVMANLRAQQSMDQRMISELRKELEITMLENDELNEKLHGERDITQRLNKIIEDYERADYDRDVFKQNFMPRSTPNISVDFGNNLFNFSDICEDDEEIEHQTPVNGTPVPIQHEKSYHSPALKNLLPLSQYLQIAPTKSTVSDQSEHDTSHPETKSSSTSYERSDEPKSALTEPKNMSLVQELDTQYKTLLEKYEVLLKTIEAKHAEEQNEKSMKLSTPNSSIVNDEVSNLSRSSSLETLPEYKRLFKELFSLINDAKFPGHS